MCVCIGIRMGIIHVTIALSVKLFKNRTLLSTKEKVCLFKYLQNNVFF